ncbi:auxin response factor 12-like [Fagus crenata]
MLFCEIGELGLVADQYTMLINGFFKKGLKKDGFELYEKMKQNGVFPNLYTYNCMTVELFSEMCERGVVCNVVTYNMLAGGFCQERRVWEVDGPNEKHWYKSKLITSNTLIYGFCNVGRFDKASCLFDQLKSIDQSPTLVTYIVLFAIADLFREMEEEGISSSKVTYTILINEASKLPKSMSEMHLEQNDVTYNTMILGYCKEGSSYMALRLLKEMGEGRLVPNVATYYATVSSC